MNDQQLLKEFRQYLIRQGRSEGTLTQRIGDIRRLKDNLGELSGTTRENLENYIDLATAEWSPAYRKKVYASYRAFFYWAKRRRLIDRNPSKRLDTVRVPRYLPRPLPEEVVLEAFDAASNIEAAMLCLGATQGLRRTEIATAHPKFRDGSFLRVTGKGAKERIVPLDPLTLSLLEQIERDQSRDEYYFRGRFGGHLHPSTVYKWLKRHLGSDWSTHNLRHRAASHGLQTTGDLRGVQELLGHASLTSTQIYTFVAVDQLRHIVGANSLRTELIERRLAQVVLDQTANVVLPDEEVLSAMRVLAVHIQRMKMAPELN